MAMEPNMARRLWHVVRAVLFMLRKGMPNKRKLAMDLHLLVHRGKIAGKALGNLMTAHSHHDSKATAAAAAGHGASPQQLSSGRGRRAAHDPSLAVYDPRGTREVEFSCSNTPSYPSLHLNLIPTGKRRRSSRRGTHRGANGAEPGWYNYDAADIARVFEILNSNDQLLSGGDDDGTSSDRQPSPLALIATPSPAQWASFGRTPAHVRQLRITDSPFPLRDGGDSGQVDLDAEEFIKKFYEQLRTQQSLATATPDYYGGGYAPPVTGIA